MLRLFRKFKIRDQINRKSILHGLSEILDANELQRVALHSSDWRELVDVAVRELKIDRRKTIRRLGEILDLPTLLDVPPADLEALSLNTPISEYRRSGAIPLTERGLVTGIVCVDPSRINRLGKDIAQLPIVFSLWSSISEALEESEKMYRERLEQRSSLRKGARSDRHSLALKMLAMLVNEVNSYGQSSVTIDFNSREIVYQFITDEDRTGTGFMELTVSECLSGFLCRAGSSQAKTAVIVDDRIVDLEVIGIPTEPGEYKFLLSWELFADDSVLEKRGDIGEGGVPYKKSQQFRSHYELDNSTTSLGAAIGEYVSPSNSNLLEPVKCESLSGTTEASGDRIEVALIDDNTTFLKILEKYFSGRGFLVKTFENSTRALEEIRSGRIVPEVLICDVHMPGLTGIQLIKQIRSYGMNSSPGVVMLSSDDDIETELCAIEAGADTYIYKHVDSRLLLAHVKRLLEKARTVAV